MRNMTITALLIGLATLGACSGDEEKDDTGVEDTATDTGAYTGSDTGDTADTADTAETGDTATDPQDTGSDTGSDTGTGTDTGADTGASEV